MLVRLMVNLNAALRAIVVVGGRLEYDFPWAMARMLETRRFLGSNCHASTDEYFAVLLVYDGDACPLLLYRSLHGCTVAHLRHFQSVVHLARTRVVRVCNRNFGVKGWAERARVLCWGWTRQLDRLVGLILHQDPGTVEKKKLLKKMEKFCDAIRKNLMIVHKF